MSKKLKRLVGIYTVAALVALSLMSAIYYSRLADYRRWALYGSRQAFEETVGAVDALSRSLRKSVYATGGGMCASVCAEAYADALAAESALAVLPFSTQELELSAAFINTAGDYAYTLIRETAETGFDDEQLEDLTALSASASAYADMLRRLQGEVNNGLTVMDSRELRLPNVGVDEAPLVSDALLGYESEGAQAQTLAYDGKYAQAGERAAGELSEEEAAEAAARAAGVETRELRQEYSYEGEDGRRCYSAGELLICVSSRGLESMAQSRLIGQGRVSVEKAREIAEDFLAAQGFQGLSLAGTAESGGAAGFRFARSVDGALCLDETVYISVALDDGSIYMLNAESYEEDAPVLDWTVSEEQAREKLTDVLTLQSSRKVVIKSPGGQDSPCYEFSCAAENGETVRVYVDAATGQQCRIEL